MAWISHGGRRVKYEKRNSSRNTFTVNSNKDELHLEVCNECHPFYKGGKEAGLVSKTGRVEKFNRKYGFNQEAK